MGWFSADMQTMQDLFLHTTQDRKEAQAASRSAL